MTGSVQKTPNRTRMTDWLMVLATAVIAGTGILGWRILSSQLEEMQAGSEYTRTLAEAAKTQAASTASIARATEKNAEATIQVAKNAERSLKATQEALRLEQRAWVTVAGADFPKLLEAGRFLRIRVTFENTGRTPAKNVTAETTIASVREGGKLTFRGEGGLDSLSHGLIPPNAKFFSDILSKDQLDNVTINLINANKLEIYVYGIAKYEDIFRIKHWTKYCYKLLPGDTIGGICTEHNEMDEN